MAKNDQNVVVSTKKKVQILDVDDSFTKIICPSRMVISGPTLSGKSTFALKLLKHRKDIYSNSFSRIVYALPENMFHLHQKFIETLREICSFIEIVEGLPDLLQLNLGLDKNSHKLIIFDDMMTQVFESKQILELITTTSHHSNISVITICQTLFFPSKHRVTFMRNCSEKVIFHDKVDQNQLSILSRHLLPNKPNFLQECFDFIYEITQKKDLKYLLLDANPMSHLPHNCIVRSFIFPQNDGKVRPIFFFPNQS